MSNSKRNFDPAVSGLNSVASWWVLYCAFWSLTGWILSAVGWLNLKGYLLALGVGALGAFLLRRHVPPLGRSLRRRWRMTRRAKRGRKLFPLGFAALALLATLGGVLYGPGNPDGLTQRIPRTLAWLAEGRWHWMDNVPPSFNSHGTAFEWIMAPMFVFLKTDRFVFLYNTVGYLLMPGLVFSVFRRLGVGNRAAWCWMWLVPAGLCFAMQAGSIGNDMAGAVLVLCSVHFGLRARLSRSAGDLWLSALAAALFTGMKPSNLPLVLPWLVAVWPSLPLLFSRRRVLPSLGVGVVALLVSLAPVMVMNRVHDAGWLGKYNGPGPDPYQGPLVGSFGTGVNLFLGNFMPPVFPAASWWNDHAYKVLPGELLRRMEKGFEPGAAHFFLQEIQFEVSAGLGLGLSLLVACSWLWGLRVPRGHAKQDCHQRLTRWTPWLAMLVFVARMNVNGPGRLIAPYYCLLLPLLLVHPSQRLLVQRRWWKALAAAAFLMAAFMLIINPPRALWPAKTILPRLLAMHPNSAALQRGVMLYDAYAHRWDALAAIRDQLPPEARNVGFITFMSGSTMETSLWRPFGSRRIWRLSGSVGREELRRKNIDYVVIGTDTFTGEKSPEFPDWLRNWTSEIGGEVVGRAEITVLATSPQVPWYLVRVGPGISSSSP